MKVFLDSIGCRLNQGEIEAYARQFRAAGHTLVPTAGQADLAVINTCAVTAAASSDSRQKVRQAVRLGVKEIAVTGCWSTLNPQGAAALPGVQHVVPNAVKDSLVSELLHTPQETFDQEPVARQPIPGARLRTRAFIKVQDGCDNRCTFCVTTIARGEGRSLSLEAVLGDIASAVQGGAQEVVLTGVHLGSWGQDSSPPTHLRQLVQAVLERSGAARVRLSSLEPWDLDAAFFSLWKDPRLCRHLHLPLQSGSAATLRRMARKTTPESFSRLVAAARAAVPDMALTTDIIVGFPGESQAEFQESLEFVRAMRFAGGHVFSYSPRAGTAAARMPAQVPPALRKERSAQVRAALAESSLAYQAEHVGRVLPVLWESATALGPQGWRLSGLTDNYLRVQAEAGQEFWNRITPVLITGHGAQGLAGSVHGSLHLL